MVDFYNNFAEYYKELAGSRDHFQLQANVLERIFQKSGINKTDNILDAACGTGDTANILYDKGYKNISMSDGSKDMIDISKKYFYNSNIPIEKCLWQNLSDYFNKNGLFNTIYIFGNSLSHAKIDSLKSIFTNIYKGLKSGGYFIFDIRKWGKDNKGFLIQSHKPNNTTVELGCFFIHDKKYVCNSTIKYDHTNNIQTVSYMIKNYHSKGKTKLFNLEYSIFTFDTIFPIIKASGFNGDNIKITDGNWPYQIIICKK